MTTNAEYPTIPFSGTSDQREQRIGKAMAVGLDYCLFCGRGTDKGLSVHMTYDGTLFPNDEDHNDDPNSQGWFGVGPECARKVPRRFVNGL